MIGEQIALAHALPDGAVERYNAFHAMLTDWNRRMDLTSIDEHEALDKHYLDALTALELLPHGAKTIDIGTGAGFPGVPLAIARPDLRMTLLDARQKRIDFLKQAIQGIDGLKAEAVHARVEDYAKMHRSSFDIALSRAVTSLPLLMEWMLPLLRIGGQCIAWKGPSAAQEVQEAERLAPMLGAGNIRLIQTKISDKAYQHSLVCIEKIEETSARFPRKAGIARKRPL